MKKMLLTMLLLCCGTGAARSAALTARDIVQKRDSLMRGASSYGVYEMTVTAPRWQRTVHLTAWSAGTDKSFILLTYPQKDADTTFLRIGTDMWQYIPRIERTVKIPPSMMLQSWLGSDFTNDDLAKESSIVDDYTHTLAAGTDTAYEIRSIPRPSAAVVWGSVVQWIDKATFVPVKDEFYDESGTPVRRIVYDNVQALPDRSYPMRWTVTPLTPDKQGHTTTLVIQAIRLDSPVDAGIFSRQSLQNPPRRE